MIPLPHHLSLPPMAIAGSNLLSARRLPFLQHRRRRKTHTIRLGSRRKRPSRRGALLLRAFRRVRIRFLALCYFRILKKLKSFYDVAVREMLAAGDAFDAAQSRTMMESYYGAVAFVPVTSYVR